MKSLLILLFFIHSLVACCQEKKSSVSFGLKLGYGMTTLGPNYTESNGYKHQFILTSGARVGGYLQIMSGKKFIFQPELLLVVKGAHESPDFSNGPPYPTYDYPFRTSYIEIPLNLLVKLPTPGGFFSLGGGPAPSFPIYRYIYSGTAGFEMGINFLTGYQWPLGFSVNLNFTKGLSNVQQFPGAPGLKNSSIGLTAGYTF
ncbi:MAG: PorT family protein [Chitinophagaceae bacterium]|nr:PorT family protein [Chitinophagaceae bacterium]